MQAPKERTVVSEHLRQVEGPEQDRQFWGHSKISESYLDTGEEKSFRRKNLGRCERILKEQEYRRNSQDS